MKRARAVFENYPPICVFALPSWEFAEVQILFTADRPLPINAAQAIAIKVIRSEYSIRSCPSSSHQK